MRIINDHQVNPANDLLIIAAEDAPGSGGANRRQYLLAKAGREIVERIMAPITAAISGYQSELDRMLDASAVYLGPGK